MEKDDTYFEEKYGRKFYNLGYGMAAGKKGTGWMAYSKGDFKEEKEPGDSDMDAIREYAESWSETDQWNYEVGDLIREVAEKEGIEEGTEEYLDNVFSPLFYSWVDGYADYILETESKRVRA